MLEYPEAYTIAKQLNESIKGKRIIEVIVMASPHKFAFFSEDRDYEELLENNIVGEAKVYGGLVQLAVGENHLYFGDGTNVRYYEDRSLVPEKHQLLLVFADNSCLVISVQMYGRISLYTPDTELTFYDEVAIKKPAIDSDEFNYEYFKKLWNESDPKLSAKAFLATEQRIPGLGNGILQDILWQAEIHPKTKIAVLTETEKENLYQAVKNTTKEMVTLGGRDTEKDLYGNEGGYQTILSKKTMNGSCPRCGGPIERKAFLGGNVYYCSKCQIEKKR